MDMIDAVVQFLKERGATDVQPTKGDEDTQFERVVRITWVYEGRAYELRGGLVRQHGGIGH